MSMKEAVCYDVEGPSSSTLSTVLLVTSLPSSSSSSLSLPSSSSSSSSSSLSSSHALFDSSLTRHSFSNVSIYHNTDHEHLHTTQSRMPSLCMKECITSCNRPSPSLMSHSSVRHPVSFPNTCPPVQDFSSVSTSSSGASLSSLSAANNEAISLSCPPKSKVLRKYGVDESVKVCSSRSIPPLQSQTCSLNSAQRSTDASDTSDSRTPTTCKRPVDSDTGDKKRDTLQKVRCFGRNQEKRTLLRQSLEVSAHPDRISCTRSETNSYQSVDKRVVKRPPATDLSSRSDDTTDGRLHGTDEQTKHPVVIDGLSHLNNMPRRPSSAFQPVSGHMSSADSNRKEAVPALTDTVLKQQNLRPLMSMEQELSLAMRNVNYLASDGELRAALQGVKNVYGHVDDTFTPLCSVDPLIYSALLSSQKLQPDQLNVFGQESTLHSASIPKQDDSSPSAQNVICGSQSSLPRPQPVPQFVPTQRNSLLPTSPANEWVSKPMTSVASSKYLRNPLPKLLADNNFDQLYLQSVADQQSLLRQQVQLQQQFLLAAQAIQAGWPLSATSSNIPTISNASDDTSFPLLPRVPSSDSAVTMRAAAVGQVLSSATQQQQQQIAAGLLASCSNESRPMGSPSSTGVLFASPASAFNLIPSQPENLSRTTMDLILRAQDGDLNFISPAPPEFSLLTTNVPHSPHSSTLVTTCETSLPTLHP
ncbi:hypothetical protein AB6A40_009451 [Gnathostoma spinigerum]|uniref:C2H2-type domain-containing protein n=1 Tax=Gnathostoma spinigerum TaxID=75299 RepID=A0ABD6F0P4_9BILA